MFFKQNIILMILFQFIDKKKFKFYLKIENNKKNKIILYYLLQTFKIKK
jgi:hypothetical protein